MTAITLGNLSFPSMKAADAYLKEWRAATPVGTIVTDSDLVSVLRTLAARHAAWLTEDEEREVEFTTATHG